MEKETKSSKPFNIEKEHPVLDERLLNKNSLHELEYKLIPLYVWTIERKNADAAKLYDFSVWSQDLIRRMYSTKVIEWNEIVCDVMGDMNTEGLVVYEFPKPTKEPLAKFGAIYINKLKKVYAYYTLEKSYNGYMMGSTDVDRHFNMGKREDMSKEAFVKEICETLELDKTLLEKKKVVRMGVRS
jgi:hypothetical protein